MFFIGDAHGKIPALMKIVRKLEPHPTFQLGDMGIGFKGVGFGQQRETFGWIRGNHDDPAKCRSYYNYIGDVGTRELEGRRMFWLAGAFSIDAAYRIPGVSWWADEELSQAELDAAVELYLKYKPDLVFSHECPQEIGQELLKPLMVSSGYFNAKFDCCTSRTAVALQRMWNAHQPRDWVFGHYHIDKDLEIRGTHFHCCAELSTYEIPQAK